ncbi:MAG: metal-dependent transcriptional regulator [Actinobacteria bacterium]|nr:metal-dependent transcriptional regulator [Actinomycetota bacterium]
MADPGVGYESREWHPAFEEYCEAIFELQEDDIETIRSRIAERLGVSRPAVTEMTRKLEEAELVAVLDGRLELTESGRRLGERVVRRHRLAERFLTDILKLSWAESHHEAGKWEHVISEKVEAAMVRVLGEPTTCPHGNPIPGSDYRAPDALPLSQVDVGHDFTVTRIPEDLEWTPGVLEYLEESRIVPGARATMTALSPDGTATVEIAGRRVALGATQASKILVTRNLVA